MKLALSCSVIGLISLFVISISIELPSAEIGQIEILEPESEVRITGTVSKVTDRDKIMYLDVVQPEAVNVMLFKSSNFSIQKGDFVEIQGEIQEYKGRKQLLANKIELFE